MAILLLFLIFLNFGESDFQWSKYESQALQDPLNTYQELTLILEKSTDLNQLELGQIQSLRGKLLFDFGLYQEATLTLYEAEEYLSQTDCGKCLAINHNFLGELYYRVKGPEESLERHQKALKIFEDNKDQKGFAQTMGFIGTMYEKQGDYPQAIKSQFSALRELKGFPEDRLEAFIFENLGSIYEDLELYDSSKFYFSKALQINLALNDKIHLSGNYNNLGDIARKTGDLEEGLRLSRKALDQSLELGSLSQQKSAWVDLSKTYALRGDFNEAYLILEKVRKLDEEIFTEETAKQISIQEAQYDLRIKNAQIQQLEKEASFQSQFRTLLVFLLLLIVGIALLIFNRQKLKIRTGKALVDQQAKTLQIKERLIATEKENINLLEARMSLEVESQSKALTAQTVHLLEKNQMLEEIRQKLKKALDVDVKDQKKRIRHLIKQIDYNFSQDTDWEDFKSSFEKVHQDFFRSISKSGVELSPAEMKLASLIRMNLSSKEISATLGISLESLRISRYRLRKKLGLQKGESLQNYILCI